MIAFMGLGRMGVPMVERLVAAGREMTVWNRTPRGVAGAVTAAGPAEAVAGAEVVVTTRRERRVEALNPATVPATNGFYSHATRAGGLLFVSGQVALDDDGELVGPDDMAAQSERVMVLLGRILADQGCTFEDVTHVRTFVTDLSRLREYGVVRNRYFPKDPPASTTVEVSRLFIPGALLEVEATASLPS
ncbi:Rid family hydrolase [Actinocorallia sp. B10E7]|uniref:RidA family protein n=1 Tax=Actinocorallia sp. B10E7 TaxID=3153558 RepID=UPI00325C5C4E